MKKYLNPILLVKHFFEIDKNRKKDSNGETIIFISLEMEIKSYKFDFRNTHTHKPKSRADDSLFSALQNTDDLNEETQTTP